MTQQTEEELDRIAAEEAAEAQRWDEDYRRRNPKVGVKTVEGIVVGRGANKKVVPPEEVYKLASIGCTIEEISKFFGVARETIKYNFNEDIERGKAETKQRLRRAQLESALVDRNVTMLIWLGKQMLGQADQPVNSDDNQILPWND